LRPNLGVRPDPSSGQRHLTFNRFQSNGNTLEYVPDHGVKRPA
jgi:hypothetical protein